MMCLSAVVFGLVGYIRIIKFLYFLLARAVIVSFNFLTVKGLSFPSIKFDIRVHSFSASQESLRFLLAVEEQDGFTGYSNFSILDHQHWIVICSYAVNIKIYFWFVSLQQCFDFFVSNSSLLLVIVLLISLARAQDYLDSIFL